MAVQAAPGGLTLEVDGKKLDGAIVGANPTVTAKGKNIDSVKFVLDGKYLGKVDEAPFATTLTLSKGTHKIRARTDNTSVTAEFTVGDAPTDRPRQRTVDKPKPVPTEPATTRTRSSATPLVFGTEIVAVTTSDELQTALSTATSGQTIELADGTYSGKFIATGSGTRETPISLKGSRAAILDGGTSGYTLNLKNANYWNFVGFTVTGGEKGIMTDESSNNVLSGLDVGNTGMEAVHFRNFSSNNTLEDSVIHDTGSKRAAFGEGVYIGTAKSNLKAKTSATGGKPDASDNNRIIGNTISNVTAEAIDIKEGTSGGVVQGNTLDGSAISGDNYADSLIDVKGSGYTISNNTAIGETGAMTDLFQTHVITDGSGVDNVFSGNDLSTVKVSGYGINVTKGANTVACDNVASGAALGISNVECS